MFTFHIHINYIFLVLTPLNSAIVGRGGCESRPADGGRRLPIQPPGGGGRRRRRCAWRGCRWRRCCCCRSRRQQALRILSHTRPRHYLPRLAKFTCKSCNPFCKDFRDKTRMNRLGPKPVEPQLAPCTTLILTKVSGEF